MRRRIIAIALCLISINVLAQETLNIEKIDALAERMLVYQLKNGGWPKQLEDKSVVDYSKPLTDDLLAKIKATPELHATIDNSATSRELNHLMAAYAKTKNPQYLKAIKKGLDYLLKAQYANGGWPQYFPDNRLYRAQVTFNDNAIVNVLNIMMDIVQRDNGYELVANEYQKQAEKSVLAGIDCILKTQIAQNGVPTIWGAQYDEKTLKPAKARAFEPASLAAAESASIVKFLIRIKKPSASIKTAITNAMKWFDTNKISDVKFERGKGIVAGLKDEKGALAWARFYDIDSNQPIFGDRDNTIKTKFEDVSLERRNGYAWYGNWAEKLLEKDYPKWLQTNQ